MLEVVVITMKQGSSAKKCMISCLNSHFKYSMLSSWWALFLIATAIYRIAGLYRLGTHWPAVSGAPMYLESILWQTEFSCIGELN